MVTALDLYGRIYLIRAAERRIVDHYGEDEMRTPMHMSMGQEAVAVALCAALGPSGQVYGSYRSHALFLAKTGDVGAFFGELYGRTTGSARGKAGSMHLADPDAGLMCASAIVGSTIPAAVGTAFANDRLKNGRRCAVMFGDGALEEGGFWESLNAACVMRIPVLFLCEDNGYAVHTPKHLRHGFDSIVGVVRKFRCTYDATRGTTDVQEILAVVESALHRAAEWKCPAFVHVETYRYLDHIGIEEDLHIGYRGRSEHNQWRRIDPLDIQRRRLIAAGMLEDDVAAEERRIEDRVDSALWAAMAAPLPDPSEVAAGVFYHTAPRCEVPGRNAMGAG